MTCRGLRKFLPDSDAEYESDVLWVSDAEYPLWEAHSAHRLLPEGFEDPFAEPEEG